MKIEKKTKPSRKNQQRFHEEMLRDEIKPWIKIETLKNKKKEW